MQNALDRSVKAVTHESMARARFPPMPSSFRGRARELRTLTVLVRAQHPTVLALIGSGGSGKSTLACALGHRLSRLFEGRLLWIRIGAWDRTTVLQMMAMQLGLRGSSNPLQAVRAALSIGRAFIVLDNHEDDAVTAACLEALRGLPVTWVITARRCLLGGVTIFPVIAPLIVDQKNPFPKVARLTRILRWHAVALDLADALVSAKRVTESELERRLTARKVDAIRPLAHEDDIPEVRAMVAESLKHVSATGKRMLGALAHMRGDNMDRASLGELGRAGQKVDQEVDGLLRLRLIQEPSRGRYALHATVHYALAQDIPFDEEIIATHYLKLFERSPERLVDEQTHLFALMDWAQEKRELPTILRVHALSEAMEWSEETLDASPASGRKRA